MNNGGYLMEQYDYVMIKPELNEETLAHYGIKGMKWRKLKRTFDKIMKGKVMRNTAPGILYNAANEQVKKETKKRAERRHKSRMESRKFYGEYKQTQKKIAAGRREIEKMRQNHYLNRVKSR